MIGKHRSSLWKSWIAWFSFSLILTIPFYSAAQLPAESKTSKGFSAMGTRFNVTLTLDSDQQDSAQIFLELAEAEVRRIENLISSWSENSETWAVNHAFGNGPERVSAELFQLVERSLKISKITDGAFDISFASIDPIWKFDGSMNQIPDSAAVSESRNRIDHTQIHLDAEHRSIQLGSKGLKIGFGGIGKGYAADQVKKILTSVGVKRGSVDAGGDVLVWSDSDDRPWTVGIQNPTISDKAIIGDLQLTNMAVATSGDYERFVEIDGQRFAHIIDPRTGWPVQGVASVSVVCQSAEMADALATAVFVMGRNAGLNLIGQLSEVECIFIDSAGNISTTPGIQFAK